MTNLPADVETLAEERYPKFWQLPERLAFIQGFLTADPSKAVKAPGRKRNRHGERASVLRLLDVGNCIEVPLRDSRNWATWRSTASYMGQTYGCLFTVRRKKDDRSILIITRLR